MKTAEALIKFGKFLNSQGYEIDLSDDLWMEDYRFGEHKIRDIFELCTDFAAQSSTDKAIIAKQEELIELIKEWRPNTLDWHDKKSQLEAELQALKDKKDVT
jgi:hypothetical protein